MWFIYRDVKKTLKIKKSQRAQAFIISVWVLVILTMIALSIGHRVSVGLRLSGFYKDRFEAALCAKAAVNRAIEEVLRDPDAKVDTLQDNWVDNKTVFEKIVLNNAGNSYGSVSYKILGTTEQEIHFGVRDEERMININLAPKELLVLLLEECDIQPSDEVAQNILIWRGDLPDTDKVYERLGYPAKGNKLSVFSELSLIKGIDVDQVEKLKQKATIYGSDKLNINTASEVSFNLLTRYLAKKLSLNEGLAIALVSKIIDLRTRKGYFKDGADMGLDLFDSGEMTLFNELMQHIVFKSQYFSIRATGQAHLAKRSLTVIFDRLNKKIIYAHES